MLLETVVFNEYFHVSLASLEYYLRYLFCLTQTVVMRVSGKQDTLLVMWLYFELYELLGLHSIEI